MSQNHLGFFELAEAYPPLKPHVITTLNGTAIIDFKNEVAQRRLTEAILHRDFGLKMILPSGRLCPPVPNRHNYILWLKDLTHAISLATPSNAHPRSVQGLDVGTGASAIYPLLGCRVDPDWMFTATDIDSLSLEYARKNVQLNELQSRIHVISADLNGPILWPLFHSDVKYDFTMCNPPFYSSREEVTQSAEAKESEPHAVCTGADVEMITPGGEAAFVGRIVKESLQLREKCSWFTSMLGKMSSLTHVVALLRENKVGNYAITELVQGQTRRWVIAWSYGDLRLPDRIGRLSHPGLQSIMPRRNTLHQRLARARSVHEVARVLSPVLGSVDGLRITRQGGSDEKIDVVVSATENTWSRAARRKKQSGTQVEHLDEHDSPVAVQLVCRILCEGRSGSGGMLEEIGLEFDWLAGIDRGLFESFASHVERKVANGLESSIA